MATWKLMTCLIQGEAFVDDQTLEWPNPPLGQLKLAVNGEGSTSAEEVEFDLQAELFSRPRSGLSSDGRYQLTMVAAKQPGFIYLTGAITRINLGGEDDDIESLTGVADDPEEDR